MRATQYWIWTAISFFVSMIFSLISVVFGPAAFGGIFVILMLITVLTGWALWFIGLVNYLRMR